MEKGIDYSSGLANIDNKTGIHFGVISINSLHEFIWDELEPEYGEPHCPCCGESVIESKYGKDYYCENCETNEEIHFIFGSGDCYPDEPIEYKFENSEYTIESAFDNTCLFVTESPYYTFASYCSPCAPGAGDLDSPCESGTKTYCFGHDMFDDNKAPYPVYRVSDDSLVASKSE